MVAWLFLTGCSTKVMDFTILSTYTSEVSRVDLKKMPKQKMSASDGRFWFLFIPFGTPSMKAAVDKCLEKGKGDIMFNGSIYSNAWSLLLFSYDSYSVEGSVVNSTGDRSRDVIDNEGPGRPDAKPQDSPASSEDKPADPPASSNDTPPASTDDKPAGSDDKPAGSDDKPAGSDNKPAGGLDDLLGG